MKKNINKIINKKLVLKSFINVSSPKHTFSVAWDQQIRHFFSYNAPVEFFSIQQMSAAKTAKVIEKGAAIKEYPHGMRLPSSVSNSPVSIIIEDVLQKKEEHYGQIICLAKSKATVRYGEEGIVPSAAIPPETLLTKSFSIPVNTLGILNIKQHIPFVFDANPKDLLLQSSSHFVPFLEHEKNIGRYALNTVLELSQEEAKRVSLRMQYKIHSAKEKEDFYEETTFRVYAPTHTRDSGTLMAFSSNLKETTDTHFHPGDRSLLIFTTDKEAWAELNSCGIHENPKDRKDCETIVKFPPNSICVLQFPAFMHHKFGGEFVCLSIHPREGPNLIRTLQETGKLSMGFLEYATVFSKGTQNWTERVKDIQNAGKKSVARYM